jgi:hypothetical protein
MPFRSVGVTNVRFNRAISHVRAGPLKQVEVLAARPAYQVRDRSHQGLQGPELPRVASDPQRSAAPHLVVHQPGDDKPGAQARCLGL